MINIVEIVDDFNAGRTVALMGDLYDPTVTGTSFLFNQAIRQYLSKGLIKSITVPMRTHQDYIGNKDLESIGFFTVGRGKVKYHDFIWYSTGSCMVCPIEMGNSPRYLKGTEMITIHFEKCW